MKLNELVQAMDIRIAEALTREGFRRISAGLWNRLVDEELSVVQIQEHSAKDSFCINLGVHYAFLPKAGTETPLDAGHIEVTDCELTLRLTETDDVRDQWWPISASGIEQAATLVSRKSLQVFRSYRLDGPIAALDGKSIESGAPGPLSSMTKVRAYLLLARLHRHLGNREKSVELATLGIKIAGMAVGPKKALKEILGPS